MCLWAEPTHAITQAQDQFIPVVITDQLPARDGVIPVYLFCGQARLSKPNQLDEFHCAFKNHTNQNITAANIIYSIVIDRNGSTIKDSMNSTVTALVHPDFRATSKLIGPGEDCAVGPPGPISYTSGAVIKGVEISIDYVEFEDGMSLGPDKEGSRIIKAMRTGARKYRTWLKLRYKDPGESVAAMASDLEREKPLPAELEFADASKQLGANEYRRRLQKIFQTKGASETRRLLDSN